MSLLPTSGPLAKRKLRRIWLLRIGPPQRQLMKKRSSSGRAPVFRSSALLKPASKPATQQQPPLSTPNFWLHGNQPILACRNLPMPATTLPPTAPRSLPLNSPRRQLWRLISEAVVDTASECGVRQLCCRFSYLRELSGDPQLSPHAFAQNSAEVTTGTISNSTRSSQCLAHSSNNSTRSASIT